MQHGNAQQSTARTLLIGAGIGNACVGLSSLFILCVGLDPIRLGLYRMGISCLIFCALWWVLRDKTNHSIPSMKWWLLTLAGSACWVLELTTWQLSIARSGAGIATLLNNLQLFIVPFFGTLFLGDRFSKRTVVSCCIAFAGLWLVLSGTNAGMSSKSQAGILWGVASGIAYAGYLCISRLAATLDDQVRPVSTMFVHCCFSTLGFLSLTWTLDIPSSSALDAQTLLLLLLYALICQAFGWVLIQRSLANTSGSATSLMLLIQPIAAVLIDVFYAGGSFSVQQVIGFAIVLSAMMLTLGSEFLSRSLPKLAIRPRAYDANVQT